MSSSGSLEEQPRAAGSATATWLAVAIGGAIGALLRWGLELALGAGTGWHPATLLANTTGSFALGALVAAWPPAVGGDGWLRTGLGTGLLGGYTTYSALALAAVADLGAGAVGAGLLWLGLNLLLGIGAAAAGLRVGGRRGRPAAAGRAAHVDPMEPAGAEPGR